MSKAKRPPPPRLAPKPGMVKAYKALFPYTPDKPDELAFEEGDTLYILDQTDDNWWKASCNGKNGMVPSNYVAPMDFPLHEAAKRGNLDFLQECLREKFPLNAIDKSGSTALYWASHGGHAETVEELLSRKLINLDIQNKLGDTALHAAAWKGHPDVIRMLLGRGADRTIRNNENKLPYDLALNKTHSECAAQLKQKQANAADDDYVGDGYDSD